MSVVKMASIGRGRGRARSLLSKIGGDPFSSNAVPKNDVFSFSEVEKSLVLCLKSQTNANKDQLLKQAKSMGTDEGNITKLVHLLCEKCIEDLDLACASGEVVSSLIELPNLGNTFRTILLKRVQHFYKDRDETKKTTFGRFLGFATMLCSLFKSMRVNEEPLRALVAPIYGLLEELLDGNSSLSNDPADQSKRIQREEEVETFHNCLVMVADLLETSDKNKTTELFKKVRVTIIKKGSPKMRCFLLEVLECHVSGNWAVKSETNVYYNDLLMDIMAER